MSRYKLQIILTLILVGCTPVETPSPVAFSPVPTPIEVATSTATLWVPTETPALTATPEPRTLTICFRSEPDSLFLYGGIVSVSRSVLEAIYDGPIDALGFDFQPVILEKLPNLADGDARIEPLQVEAGDWVVNDAGDPVQLDFGERVRPYGCNASYCAIEWGGEPLEMAQLSADFTIIEGISWSDGEPLTADDSIFSYRIAKDCETPWESQRGTCGHLGLVPIRYNLDTSHRTSHYTALDDRTVRWTGMPGFLDPNYRTNFFIPLPEHQLGRYRLEDLFEAEISSMRPIGWGPYVIEKGQLSEYIQLKKNPNYFRSSEGLPHFDTLIFRFVGENAMRNISDILLGKCDIVNRDMYFSDVVDLLLAMDRERLLQAHLIRQPVLEHLDFSLLHADYDDGYQQGIDRPDLFGDVRTRQAIAMCLDRDRLVKEAVLRLSDYRYLGYVPPGEEPYRSFYEQWNPPSTYVPQEHPLFNPDATSWPYDPEAARALLDEVGWEDDDGDPTTPRVASGVEGVADGTLLVMTYETTNSTQRQQVTALIQQSLAQCGIQTNINLMPTSEWFADGPEGPLFGRRFDLGEFAWLTGVHPPCDLFMTANIPGDPEAANPDGTPRFPKGWQGQNNSGYSNPDFDQACQSALETLPGQPGYVENHKLAQEIFARDLPVIPLFHRITVTPARIDMCGYELDAASNWNDMVKIEEFNYGEGCK